mmetsp:Transcript_4855/g.8838  ORF Transcript_4855/g.8838 Transcript_4855/m.8838 type:complete len:518 (+) Transcript_4855:140-1693(+)|eukprot:CAMPEP_0197529956 /NCGR_PEP_ID=MMETSP1318-20131121/30204_1 /TAXON_ID=552666 /ORGANISM="Partenskyella glossopodia, Strain RCC365" /LENGTH=517 /DNA_ID=CAMNT_0043085601 /DNA_START=125 /DNA_END=1678 /DNA_ORIENTATION=+
MRNTFSSMLLSLGVVVVTITTPVKAVESTLKLRGVNPKDIDLYSGSSFSCLDGSKSIERTMVNDDYCDCDDGSDEPGTSACKQGTFFCQNQFSEAITVPSSRVNDGLCDCCDGSDEWEDASLCPDTCKQQAMQRYQQQIDRLNTIREGVKALKQLKEEGSTTRADKQKELDHAKQQKDQAQQLRDQARKVKNVLEEEERAKQDARDQKKAAEEAEKNQNTQDGGDEQQVEAAQSQSDLDAAQTHDAKDKQAQDLDQDTDTQTEQEQEQQNFPYPKEYQAPGGDDDADNAEEAENFPYPEEYAAPPADGDDAEDDAQSFPYPEEYAAPSDSSGSPDESGAEQTEQQDDTPEPANEDTEEQQENQALKDARDDLSDKDSKFVEWESKVKKAEEFLERVGDNDAIIPLYEKCFEREVRQYTYEVCLFKDSYQKESGKRTKLGNYKSYNADTMEMEFDNGQRCWNGPNRSIKVKFECGVSNELQLVDEPSKCVYATVLKTPLACDEQEAEELEKIIDALNG